MPRRLRKPCSGQPCTSWRSRRRSRWTCWLRIAFTPHIPVWDMSKREEGILSRADFTFDRQRDLYICPQGKLLRTTWTVLDGRTILYRASTRDCGPCPLKPKCTPNMTFRKIPRDVHEDARDATRALMGTPEFVKSRLSLVSGRPAHRWWRA